MSDVVAEQQSRAGTAGRQPSADTGLVAEEVAARVAAGQVNTAPPVPGRSVAQILRANVLTRFNAILGALLVVVAVVGPLQDGLFGVVLVTNTAIGIAQELRAKRTLDRLAILNAPRALAVRDGQCVELAVSSLVLDDVLELRPGDQVVVDGAVLSSDNLEVDESLVSGEAKPVAKAVGDPVLSGSFVVAGTGRIRATAVGSTSYAAELEARARRFSLIRSELQQGTNDILRLVTWVMVPTGVALVLTQLLRSHQSRADALRGSVAGVSAMVPEGLVLLTTVAFAVGALRLARRRVLVQELPAVEGLARVDVLCIDKTGTLTAPGMHLSSVTVLDGTDEARVDEVLEAIVAADPAPNATLRSLHRDGAAAPGWAVTTRVPFSSARKWSAVNFADRGTWVLGAPDILAPVARGGPGAAGPAGIRSLLLARTPDPIEGPGLPTMLQSVALLGITEDLRPDAVGTVGYLLAEGITVKVLSGDAPATVGTVAAQVGIPLLGPPVDASEVADDEGLAVALGRTNVIGRVRPEQKLAAVQALQAAGHVVAMVGDGVNDVQALKQADLGIAMGSGSQSSRSVARVVLLDSSFAAVPRMLAEGRRVIANIERVANLFVTKTVYAACLAVVVAASAVPFPFFPRHLTVVSTFTIGVPGFFLALAGGAPRAVPGFTRRVLRFTTPAGLAAAAATLASYGIARQWGSSAPEARTTAMLALLVVGLWVLVLIARPLTPMKIVLVAAMATGALSPFLTAWTRQVLGLAMPGTSVLGASAGIVAGALVVLTAWRVAMNGTSKEGST